MAERGRVEDGSDERQRLPREGRACASANRLAHNTRSNFSTIFSFSPLFFAERRAGGCDEVFPNAGVSWHKLEVVNCPTRATWWTVTSSLAGAFQPQLRFPSSSSSFSSSSSYPSSSSPRAVMQDKYIGIALAVSGTVAIGSSFIITKKVRNQLSLSLLLWFTHRPGP
jgi:hypothetical protein